MDLAEALSLWWVYPAALCIATLAISTGISGALFFVPFFLLVVGVSPAEAIGGGLMTMVFGTASGAFSYVRQGVVDFTIVKSLLLVTVPFGMAGAVVSLMIDPDALRVLFGVLLFALSAFLLWSNLRRARANTAYVSPEGNRSANAHPNDDTSARPEGNRRANAHPNDAVVHARDGREYRYARPGRTVSQALGAAGALVQGFMGAGLPEATTTQLILRGPVPPRVAVGTSVTTLTVTVFFAAAIHAIGGEPPWHVVIWSCPGALTGAQFGARLQAKLPPNVSERVLAVVFVGVGVLVIALRDVG